MLLSPEINVSPAHFERLREMVYKHCGINLHEGKQELVRARIAKNLRRGGYGSAAEYLDFVLANADGEDFHDLIDSLSTNLTSFFRESSHFDYLREHFLPKLVERRRKEGAARIRAWSAGCSTGEEPYSLAITLLEATNGHGSWDVRLLATDISRRVLRHAMEGEYDPERVAAVPPALRAKYFTADRKTGETAVAQSLRALVRFNYLNLMGPWPFRGPFDFIFCRNVMIYFDKPTQEKLVNRYWECLDPGGLLFTGHSESLTGVNHRFRYVQPTIYQKA